VGCIWTDAEDGRLFNPGASLTVLPGPTNAMGMVNLRHSIRLGLLSGLVVFALAAAGCEKMKTGEDEGAKDDKASKAAKPEAKPKPKPKPKPTAKPEAEAKPSAPKLETPKSLKSPPTGAQKSKSGLAWVVLDEGKGDTGAKGFDKVDWHYRSWDPTGRLLFDTYEKGAPKHMKVSRMLAGYREAIADMKVGERRRVWIPAKLAHKKRKKVTEADNRIVDLHLVSWFKAQPPPKDLKKPPKTAKKTESGLRIQFLKRGEGEQSALPEDQVEVRYSGWRQKNGENFDFTGPGETSTFGASTVIKGWVETLRTMVIGDKVRVWIPAELAYKGKPSKPQGTLVFDIELVNIIRAKQ